MSTTILKDKFARLRIWVKQEATTLCTVQIIIESPDARIKNRRAEKIGYQQKYAAKKLPLFSVTPLSLIENSYASMTVNLILSSNSDAGQKHLFSHWILKYLSASLFSTQNQ